MAFGYCLQALEVYRKTFVINFFPLKLRYVLTKTFHYVCFYSSYERQTNKDFDLHRDNIKAVPPVITVTVVCASPPLLCGVMED